MLIHEVGHNWDDEFELVAANPNLSGAIDSFRALSGWSDVDPQVSSYTLSADGEWWYLNTAVFEDDYGRTNPHEDYAVAWEIISQAKHHRRQVSGTKSISWTPFLTSCKTWSCKKARANWPGLF